MNALASRALEEVGLGDRVNYVPSGAGGHHQRVAIARALVADEHPARRRAPGKLDTAVSTEVMSIFDKLHKDGRTIVMVTHCDDRAARQPDHQDSRRQDRERQKEGGIMKQAKTVKLALGRWA